MRGVARNALRAGLVLGGALLLGAGSCEAPAVAGRVVDRETRAPIAGVGVFEVWRSGRVLSDVAATRHTRTARTDRDGRFSLASEASVRGAGAPQAPSYVLVHRDYGLVHAGERDPRSGALAFELSRGDAAAQRSLASLCESPPREEWERAIAREFCSRR